MGDGPLRWDGYERASGPLLSASGSPNRAPHEEPPKQQRADAQLDQVQREELHVAGDERRCNDQGDHPGHHDPLPPPPRHFSGALSAASLTGS